MLKHWTILTFLWVSQTFKTTIMGPSVVDLWGSKLILLLASHKTYIFGFIFPLRHFYLKRGKLKLALSQPDLGLLSLNGDQFTARESSTSKCFWVAKLPLLVWSNSSLLLACHSKTLQMKISGLSLFLEAGPQSNILALESAPINLPPPPPPASLPVALIHSLQNPLWTAEKHKGFCKRNRHALICWSLVRVAGLCFPLFLRAACARDLLPLRLGDNSLVTFYQPHPQRINITHKPNLSHEPQGEILHTSNMLSSHTAIVSLGGGERRANEQ